MAPHLTGVQLQEVSSTRKAPLAPIEPHRKHVQTLFALREPSQVAFQPGIPAFDAFPRALWSRLLARQRKHLKRTVSFIAAPYQYTNTL